MASAGLKACIHPTPRGFLGATGSRPIGCVLLDMNMLDIDGVTLLRALTEAGMTAPVIVMMGHGDSVDAGKVLRMGTVDFIEKPFAAQQLLGAVDGALTVRAAYRKAVVPRGGIEPPTP